MVIEAGARLGTGGRPPTIGLFIRDFLRENGEGYASGMHKAYKEAYRGQLTLGGKKYRLSTYNSFAIYASMLVNAGLLERTNHVERSDNPKGEPLDYPERVYLRLSRKGEGAMDYVWMHPLRLWHRPFDWEWEYYGEYIKPK